MPASVISKIKIHGYTSSYYYGLYGKDINFHQISKSNSNVFVKSNKIEVIVVSLQNYKEMEDKVSAIFSTFEGELKGKYYPLTGMDKATQQQLIDDHFLFKEGDR